ncbi:MAG: GWxTD domain-containing protein [Balneolaceae bacterium]
MKALHIHTKPILLLCLAGTLLSCSRASNPDIERGTSYYFQDGHPEIRVSALGYLNLEDQPIISITTDIVHGSLIFREVEGVNTSEITLEIRIIGVEGTTYTDNYRTEFTITNEQEGYVTTQDVMKFEREMEVPPGNYEVVVSVIDQTSGNETIRTVNTYIPDPGDDIINLTSVQLLSKDNDGQNPRFLPVTTYDVPASMDSLRFLVQVTNNRSEDPLVVDARLLQFESDTSAARFMSSNNYSPSTMPYRGINYSNSEEVDISRRVLEQAGVVMIEYNFPLPERGNYRFEVNAASDNAEDLFKARDFSIKSENYPAIQTPRELAEPLAYLMSEDEYEQILSIQEPEQLKEAIDRFWLSNVQSTSRARQVISLYYERVEEANKQFSNFKEGWKTDPGMIYILFGPPWYVERRMNFMLWAYSYDRTDSRYNFTFERPKMRNEFFPFDNYLLNRSQQYFNQQYQQVQLWRTGAILDTNL